MEGVACFSGKAGHVQGFLVEVSLVQLPIGNERSGAGRHGWVAPSVQPDLTHARPPQFPQVGVATMDSTVISSRPTNGSTTSSTLTAGRPTNSSQTRVASNIAGALQDRPA